MSTAVESQIFEAGVVAQKGNQDVQYFVSKIDSTQPEFLGGFVELQSNTQNSPTFAEQHRMAIFFT